MALLAPTLGELQLLGVMLGRLASEDLKLRLYSNDLTPGEADEVGDLTEVTGGGYAEKTLAKASWSAANPSVYAEQTWSFSASVGDIYGYYIVGATSGILLWLERFDDAPFDVSGAGIDVKVTPSIDMD